MCCYLFGMFFGKHLQWLGHQEVCLLEASRQEDDYRGLGRYDFGLFWDITTGKQILPCVTETKRFGLIGGHVGGV